VCYSFENDVKIRVRSRNQNGRHIAVAGQVARRELSVKSANEKNSFVNGNLGCQNVLGMVNSVARACQGPLNAHIVTEKVQEIRILSG